MTKKIRNVLRTNSEKLADISVTSKQQELDSDPQSELYQLAADVKNNTLMLGSRLLVIQEEELYLDWGYFSFTEWLKDFSRKSAVKLTKLWDSKKIVKMLLETETSFNEVENVSVKGLYQISRIQKSTQNNQLTKRLIVKLKNGEIAIPELKEIATGGMIESDLSTIVRPLEERSSDSIKNANSNNSKAFFRRFIRRILSFNPFSNVSYEKKSRRSASSNVGRS